MTGTMTSDKVVVTLTLTGRELALLQKLSTMTVRIPKLAYEDTGDSNIHDDMAQFLSDLRFVLELPSWRG